MRIYHPRRSELVGSRKSARSKTKSIALGESRWEMHKPAFHEASIFVRLSETRKPLNLGEITPRTESRGIPKRSVCHQ